MLFQELLEVVQVLSAGGQLNTVLTGITYDSRKVQPGFLFVAVRGFKHDGAGFIEQALEKGAVAVVTETPAVMPSSVAWARVPDSRQALALMAEHFYENPSGRIKMIGVTGTNGKTTTTNLIAAVLDAAGHKTGLIGTIHNRIADMILDVSHTTPESADLQELLHEMILQKVNDCVMEVSSHALALHRVDGCEFDVAVFTNLTQDHLDFHNDMQSYLEAKQILFRKLSIPGVKRGKCAVVNADDAYAGSIIKATGVEVYTYGIKQEADVQADNVQIGARGVSFTVTGKWGRCPLELRITGLFNVYNTLAAFTACAAIGIPVEVIKKALESMQGVPGRFELVDADQNFAVIVDYAHTPDGLENVLKTAREITTEKLITVFGCGGDRDRTKRPLMGRIAAKYSDYVLVTSDNPRTEAPLDIIKDIEKGLEPVVKKEGYTVEADRRRAIRLAVGIAKKGDVVVIAGKGHEDYQIIGTKKYPFDDRNEARIAIKELQS